MMHFDLYRVRIFEAIVMKRRAMVGIKELRPDIPLREYVVDREVFDIGGEALVEPQVRPPLHGNEVAKPLVRYLVGNDKSHPLAVVCRRVYSVYKQGTFSIRDGTPIFHRSGGKIWNGYHVQDWQRVRNIKVCVEKRNYFYGAIQRKFRLFFLARRHEHAYQHP